MSGPKRPALTTASFPNPPEYYSFEDESHFRQQAQDLIEQAALAVERVSYSDDSKPIMVKLSAKAPRRQYDGSSERSFRHDVAEAMGQLVNAAGLVRHSSTNRPLIQDFTPPSAGSRYVRESEAQFRRLLANSIDQASRAIQQWVFDDLTVEFLDFWEWRGGSVDEVDPAGNWALLRIDPRLGDPPGTLDLTEASVDALSLALTLSGEIAGGYINGSVEMTRLFVRFELSETVSPTTGVLSVRVSDADVADPTSFNGNVCLVISPKSPSGDDPVDTDYTDLVGPDLASDDVYDFADVLELFEEGQAMDPQEYPWLTFDLNAAGLAYIAALTDVDDLFAVFGICHSRDVNDEEPTVDTGGFQENCVVEFFAHPEEVEGVGADGGFTRTDGDEWVADAEIGASVILYDVTFATTFGPFEITENGIDTLVFAGDATDAVWALIQKDMPTLVLS